MNNIDISNAMTIKMDDIFTELPEMPAFEPGIRRAPKRPLHLTKDEMALALKNALRYIPEKWHTRLAPEFLDELLAYGRIYGYRSALPDAFTANPLTRIKGTPLKAKHSR